MADKFCSTISNPHGTLGVDRPAKLYTSTPGDHEKGAFLRNKQFVVKVQVPLGESSLGFEIVARSYIPYSFYLCWLPYVPVGMERIK